MDEHFLYENAPPPHPGIFLRHLLEKQGITQDEFAREVGLGRSYITKVVNLKRDITNRVAILVGERYGRRFGLNLAEAQLKWDLWHISAAEFGHTPKAYRAGKRGLTSG